MSAYPERTSPVAETLAEDDHVIGWLRIGIAAFLLALVGQGVGLLVKTSRAPVHIDAEAVSLAPIQRFHISSPDEVNAVGLARDIAERMFRRSDATAATDAEFVLNHMVPELAVGYQKNAVAAIRTAKELHANFGGHCSVTVRSVTPIKVDLPPFLIEVALRVEPLKAAVDVDIPPEINEGRDMRIRMTLVRTKKTIANRDALLIQEMRLIDEGKE